jgi:hypothetical protein
VISVAIEFDWYGDADVDTAALRGFIVEATRGEQHTDGTVFLDGMYIMSRASRDEDGVTVLFGFDERFSATFRFANLATEATAEHNTAVMVQVLIAFAQSYGGNGVLLYNGEENVLQYGKDGIVFASDWADWSENTEVAPLLGQFARRTLPQPLL